MVTTSTFPVPAGTSVSLSCNVGYELKGNHEVTCAHHTEYHSTVIEPFCGEFYSVGI